MFRQARTPHACNTATATSAEWQHHVDAGTVRTERAALRGAFHAAWTVAATPDHASQDRRHCNVPAFACALAELGPYGSTSKSDAVCARRTVGPIPWCGERLRMLKIAGQSALWSSAVGRFNRGVYQRASLLSTVPSASQPPPTAFERAAAIRRCTAAHRRSAGARSALDYSCAP
jgi:hypothetical protein